MLDLLLPKWLGMGIKWLEPISQYHFWAILVRSEAFRVKNRQKLR